MRGLHDVENRVLQHWLVQRIMPHRHWDPRLADIVYHHRYLSFELRDYICYTFLKCLIAGYFGLSLVFLLAVVIVPTFKVLKGPCTAPCAKKFNRPTQRLRRNHANNNGALSSILKCPGRRYRQAQDVDESSREIIE